MSETAARYVIDTPPVTPDGRRWLRVVAEPPAVYDREGEVAAQGPVDPAFALQRLRQAADLVARADLEGLEDRDLLEHTAALDRQVTRLQAQRLRALARVDQVAAFTADACVTAGSWFKMRTNRDPNVGAKLGRWTRRLDRFPLLKDAFEAGTITQDHVIAGTCRIPS